MKGKLYARELLKKLVTKEEMKVLEAVWDDQLNVEQKIESLLEE